MPQQNRFVMLRAAQRIENPADEPSDKETRHAQVQDAYDKTDAITRTARQYRALLMSTSIKKSKTSATTRESLDQLLLRLSMRFTLVVPLIYLSVYVIISIRERSIWKNNLRK